MRRSLIGVLGTEAERSAFGRNQPEVKAPNRRSFSDTPGPRRGLSRERCRHFATPVYWLQAL